MLGFVSFSVCVIDEKVNATGDLALRVFCLFLPNQAGLFGDIGGEVSLSGFSIGIERPVEGNSKASNYEIIPGCKN
ncbi:hypothetical protein [Corynebacterium deserti]|uniref:hypothetical protein n=1 Tax=Corynebacterium deserti TaxID=1408191 RepID=UPI0006AD1CD9|nr:hypothetical protein [Corynebacterium deserti]